MEYSTEPSSSVCSVGYNLFTEISKVDYVPEMGSTLEIISLNKLSSSLEQLLVSSSIGDFTDADIVVENVNVGVHRCILASRSKFFQERFKKDKESRGEKETRPKYDMSDLLPYGSVGYEAFIFFLTYLYTGKPKSCPPEVSTCVDDECQHHACRPAINFAVELMYASAIFEVPELVSLFQRRLLDFVEKALVEDVIPILVVAFRCQSSFPSTQLLTRCIHRVAHSDIDSISLEKEVPYEVAKDIKLIRSSAKAGGDNAVVADDPLREKRIRSIHKALDSDDVALVKLLLSESDITLDEATALHYAVAYCDPKVVSEVLSLDLADVNLRNTRGYTVLHVAALRKDPSIIVPLLVNGACATDITEDGRSALSICKRLTRPKDYNAKTEQGQKSNKDRLCIDVLEREVGRNAIYIDASSSSPKMTDDQNMRLLYLEERVAFARLLFPSEAKLAMDVANLREVDLNETPNAQNERKLAALSKTVDTGRRYFPSCSQVLDKFMEDYLPDDSFYLDTGSPEEQKIKRMRFIELKEEVEKAFAKDKAELQRIVSSSSSSPASLKRRRRLQS